MELDKFEYEIRDVVLEAFGKQDSLTREYLLELFDYDEPMAASIVAVLSADGLVAEVGLSEQNYLPVLLVKKPAVYTFLQNGGYTRQFEITSEKKQLGLEPEAFSQKQNTGQANAIIEDKQPGLYFDKIQQVNTFQPETVAESLGSATGPDDQQTQYLALQKENRRHQNTIKERDEQIRLLKRKIKQLEYLKRLWWLAGVLLLVVIVLAYKLHTKGHH